MELFSSNKNQKNEPLAARMRPRTLDEYAGQDHIVGKGRLLRRAIDGDQLSSLIFYGPPGTGKTTLARIIANTTKSNFLSLNAVLSGVKDLRASIEEAAQNRDLYGKRTILFVDEVHRWNKSQQDALLPWVENGTIILIGATTENPYFEVNKALVSRSRVFQLVQLTSVDLYKIADMAINDNERGYGKWNVEFEEGALEHLVDIASGDARSLLNALQLAIETTPEKFPPADGTKIYIDTKSAEESIQKKVVLYDKEGDYHFDTISAFIKSIRGSDPDAALYWMARMIRAGEDPRYIFRRMLISASEDIGLADPQGLVVVEAAASAYDRVGLPEGQFHLTHAALYLATAPKSNSSLGFFEAIKSVENEEAEVPNHLKDANRDKHSFGHGEGYQYPHAFKDHWVEQQYLPSSIKERVFYKPSDLGHEGKIKDLVLKRRELQLAAILENDDFFDTLTYSPNSKGRDQWVKRALTSKSKRLEQIRKRLFKELNLGRHERLLIPKEQSGFFLWEAFRRLPEGGVTAIFPSIDDYETNLYQRDQLPNEEKPFIIYGKLSNEGIKEIQTEGWDYEAALLYNLFNESNEIETVLNLMKSDSRIIIAEVQPSRCTTLSSIIKDKINEETYSKLKKSESILYKNLEGTKSEENILETLNRNNYSIKNLSEEIITENRFISADHINNWLDLENPSSWGSRIKKEVTESEWNDISTQLSNCSGKLFNWESCYSIIKTVKK